MRALLSRLSAPPCQTLRILQPTQSTVSYTVTTRPTPRSLTASIVHYIALQLRVVSGLCTSLLVWTKWRLTFEQSTRLLATVMGSGFEDTLIKVADFCEWMYLAPGALILLFLVFKRGYTGMDTSRNMLFLAHGPLQRNL